MNKLLITGPVLILLLLTTRGFSGYSQFTRWIQHPAFDSPVTRMMDLGSISKVLPDKKSSDLFFWVRLEDKEDYPGNTLINANSYNIENIRSGNLLVRINEWGEFIWVRPIEAGTILNLSEMEWIGDDIVIAGFIEESGSIAGEQFYIENGSTIILIVSSDSGEIKHVRQFNIKGTIGSIETGPDGIYLAGSYMPDSYFGQFKLPDGYVMSPWGERPQSRLYVGKLNQQYDPVWVKVSGTSGCCAPPILGPLHLDEATGNLIFSARSRYANSFADTVARDFESGFFMISSLTPEGERNWFRAYGTASIFNLGTDQDGRIYIDGNFQETLTMGDLSIAVEEGGYYLARLNSNGIPDQLHLVKSKQTETRSIDCSGKDCLLAGYFRDYYQIDEEILVDFRESNLDSLETGIIYKWSEDSFTVEYMADPAEQSRFTDMVIKPDSWFVNGLYVGNLTMECSQAEYYYAFVPFLVRIDTKSFEINIAGEDQTDGLMPYSLFIENYDPALDYTFEYPEGVILISDENGLVQLDFSGVNPGNYTVKVSAGCDSFSATAEKIIRVRAIVSTEDDQSVRIYPNPVDQYVFIEQLNLYDQFKLTDVNGRTILDQEISSQNETIDMAHLRAGIYFLILHSNDRRLTYCLVKK